MNYENYENRIVEGFGVDLVGWPFAKVENFGELHHSDLTILLEALENGRCHWIKLSEEELQNRMASNHARHEAGEQIYKEQKTTEKHPAPDTATEEADYFNLDSQLD